MPKSLSENGWETRPITVFGTAPFADRGELVSAGLVGRIWEVPQPGGVMKGCWYEDAYSFEPLRYRGDLHLTGSIPGYNDAKGWIAGGASMARSGG
jgi:hypothetical protein